MPDAGIFARDAGENEILVLGMAVGGRDMLHIMRQAAKLDQGQRENSAVR